jgi:hypothetical protein
MPEEVHGHFSCKLQAAVTYKRSLRKKRSWQYSKLKFNRKRKGLFSFCPLSWSCPNPTSKRENAALVFTLQVFKQAVTADKEEDRQPLHHRVSNCLMTAYKIPELYLQGIKMGCLTVSNPHILFASNLAGPFMHTIPYATSYEDKLITLALYGSCPGHQHSRCTELSELS